MRHEALNFELNFLVENGPLTVYDLEKQDPKNRNYSSHHGYVKELLKQDVIEIKETAIGENKQKKYYWGPTKYGLLTYLNEKLNAELSRKTGDMFCQFDSEKILLAMKTWSELFPDFLNNFEMLLNSEIQLQKMEDDLTSDQKKKLHESFKIQGISAPSNKKFAKHIWESYCFLALRLTVVRLIQHYEFVTKRLSFIGDYENLSVNPYELENNDLTDEFFSVVLYVSNVSSENIKQEITGNSDYMSGIYRIILQTPVWKDLFVKWLSAKRKESFDFISWTDTLGKEFDIQFGEETVSSPKS
ncbi:hypothetical protein [Methanoplanus endosymbiosus]|uniref:Uncharacterized protein n=1 Tax=Methanoplanus endosymbiosus TaxID=33865 RepID=A0A9E7TLG3_9EURY|nr:hypothetical protein [Methanoplanus endosymbiosus]UUX93720.1 hypothetical protein L6E24_06295 [Methanoplanus endosymbiosus]